MRHYRLFQEGCALGVLVGLLALGSAHAGTPVSSPVVMDIAAQDLASALQRFSELSGMAVLVDRQLTQDRRSAGVSGAQAPRVALASLLVGSGLMAVYTGTQGFTVQPARVTSAPASGRRGSTVARQSFAAAVQQAVLAALCRSTLARPGSYRAVLQLWVGPAGEVAYNRLIATTGDYARDEALVRVLHEVVIDRPPPSSMAQPVTLLLEPAGVGKRMDCHESKGGAQQ